MLEPIYVTGAFTTAFGKFPDRTIAEMATEAVEGALADSGTSPEEIGFVAVGNAISSLMTGQAMIQGQIALLDSRLAGAQIVNVENACASSSSALHLAIMAVRSGMCESAMAVGVEKMTSDDKTRAFRALGTAVDVADPSLSTSDRNSVFMNLYAQEARHYAAKTGAPPEAFAHAASIAHLHGSLNPKAQYRDTATPEQVLASRTIDDPLTLLMCSPIGDGASAIVVSSRRRPGDGVIVSGSALRSASRGEGGAFVTRVSDLAFGQAGRKPTDVDVFELHDAASSAALVILEEMGVVGPGIAWRLAMDDELRFDGSLPVNTSGGLISRGHPVGATGAAQVVEIVDQLLGRAGARQVEGARIGVAQNAGGATTLSDPYTPGVCTVTVLERV